MTRQTQLTSLMLGLAIALVGACGTGRAPNATGEGADAGLADGSVPDAGDGTCQVKYDCPPGEICSRSRCQAPPVSCHTDSECPAGLICGNGGTCAAGCSDQRDCLAPQICDPVRATCDVCSRANPCPSGESCLAGSCRPMTGCRTTSDCVGGANDGQICINGNCSQCATDADCNVPPYNTEHRLCERGICSPPAIDAGPGGCHSRYECPSGQVCLNQQCTTPPSGCQTNAECPIGNICNRAGLCVPGCADVRDCGPGQSCNAATNSCQTNGGCNLQTCSQQCASQNMQCDPMTCMCTSTMCDVATCNRQCSVQGGQCDPSTCSCTQSCDVNACTQQCAAQNLQCDANTCGCTGSTGGMCTQNSDCGTTDVCSSGACAEQAVGAGGSGGCSLIQCLLGSFGIGSPCVGASTGAPCGCQSALSGLGGGFNAQGPYACQ